jgi:hypothetical protein
MAPSFTEEQRNLIEQLGFSLKLSNSKRKELRWIIHKWLSRPVKRKPNGPETSGVPVGVVGS